MTLAQLCCTCWALAAFAELGVQGPESSYRPVKFSCCGMDCHVPGEPKKVRESCSFWRVEPNLSRNVRMSECPHLWGERVFGCCCRYAFGSVIPWFGNLDISSWERELAISFVGIFPFPKSRLQMQKPLYLCRIFL
jgi:hypothetical protein